jgi:hypothetical protein
MQYLLQLFIDESRWAKLRQDEANRDYGAYAAYTEALKEAGAFVNGEQLQPVATATMVSVAADGKTAVLDGPYADTKEQLAGFYQIDVSDLDAAISWAARCPAAGHGKVEVRPIHTM